MSAEVKKEVQLEIAHVLFIDTVGYSRLSINQQRAVVDELTEVVRSSDQYRRAEAAGRLIKIPTGDGMALVFYSSLEAPAQCAIEISGALKEHPRLQLRMGVHSGPVSGVIDVNGHANLAGAGLNMAQRVMVCGDAGHILVSKHVAEDLEEYEQWRPLLHDLGTCEMKHGMRVSTVNLYADQVGNPQLPKKFQAVKTHRARMRWAAMTTALLGIAAIIAGIAMSSRYRVLSAPEKSIAVLPFDNLSTDQGNAFFVAGIQDEILNDLAKVADLKVISRTSVIEYKTGVKRNLREIAKALGVAHVVEGAVQRTGNRVRVTAQLVDARTDMHLWAERYDRDLADVFAIQSEIAKRIADQLQVKISPNEKAAIDKPATTDLLAYDLYSRAQALWGDVSDPVHALENLLQAARLLNEALARDPDFVLAWCLLSRTHAAIYKDYAHNPGRLDLANTAVQTALRLRPDAGEAHLALANYYYYGFRDYERARSELAIAQRALPNDAEVFLFTGLIDRRQGQWAEATRNLERALELDPRNRFVIQQLALIYRPQRRYDDEDRIWRRLLTIAPGDPLTRITRAQLALHWRADIETFQVTLSTLLTENPSVAPDIDDPFFALCERTTAATSRALANYPREGTSAHGINLPPAYWEGVVARWQGDATKARAAFTAARDEVAKAVEQQPDFAAALSLLGMIDAGLGRKEDALREGRRACELLPIWKDAVDGTAFAVNLAQIYTWTGEKELAIEQIAAVERVPNRLSYGLLKLHPYWDPLRGDPRFEKIVASLAPSS